ncbi:B12-binding domain-containing radical SAM protein [Geomonas azotofigens]|uniref:B12-binding domain-containing radical SAM protein n=1 Tax=Geomonas azotofigens TaxID=2843196 RepID=UPI001C12679F|nr:cobalamin-dependent protein [Geomonas azotofigens]MBU5614678.1 cobalamin-dependent protein [Geomonas azotofigens]
MISTNRETAPQPAVPIGAAWVAEALRLAGFHVRFLDLCFLPEPLAAVEEALAGFEPDGIALSVRNLDNCNLLAPKSYLPEIRDVVRLIKARSGARILIGGAGVSILPHQVLEYLQLDHAVVGEGERAAVQFFSAPDADAAGKVPGVVRRKRTHRQDEAPAPTVSEAFVMPRLHGWVDVRRYLAREPVLPVQGKRGCAQRCLYCTYRMIEGSSWRVRDPVEVVDEILETMCRTSAREFEFVDSIFNEPEGYLELLLEEVLRRGVKARFCASSLSPKGVTEGQLRLMERAGMTSLVITPESAAGATLAALRKGFDEDEVNRAAELLGRSRLRALWCFLIGAPEEDEATLGRTVDFLNRHVGGKDAAFITTGIRIYPGTGLHRLAVREGTVRADDDLLMPSFYFSPKITPQRARAVLDRSVRHGRCIHLTDTQAPVLGALRRIGAAVGLPTPFWRYAGYAKSLLSWREAPR